MIKIKVVDLDELYNFIVYNFDSGAARTRKYVQF